MFKTKQKFVKGYVPKTDVWILISRKWVLSREALIWGNTVSILSDRYRKIEDLEIHNHSVAIFVIYPEFRVSKL